ncbi:hypothetical protein EMCRGX_G015031 [Ephydatia muelleri]
MHGAEKKLVGVKPTKCNFCQQQVGHIVSASGIATDPAKTEVIAKWPTPQTRRDLIQIIQSGLSWILHDASNYGIGAVLSQISNDGSECVIAYASRSLSRQEQRYCVTQRELLAIVEFVQHFRQYLLGRQFRLRTDHGSLVWVRNFKEPEGQLARWLERLEEYDFTVIHRRGSQHSNADALSRGPWVDFWEVTVEHFRLNLLKADMSRRKLRLGRRKKSLHGKTETQSPQHSGHIDQPVSQLTVSLPI